MDKVETPDFVNFLEQRVNATLPYAEVSAVRVALDTFRAAGTSRERGTALKRFLDICPEFPEQLVTRMIQFRPMPDGYADMIRAYALVLLAQRKGMKATEASNSMLRELLGVTRAIK